MGDGIPERWATFARTTASTYQRLHLTPILTSLGIKSFSGSLTPAEIEQVAEDPAIKTLQTSRAAEPETWKALNAGLFSRRPDICLRVYGSYGSQLNLNFLSLLPNVQHFTANCLSDAIGIEHVASLPNLKSLHVGIVSLKNFDFLKDVSAATLESLGLEATSSKAPALPLLSSFKNLRTLFLERQQKCIDVISELNLLEDVTLRSITTPNVSYLAPLPRLRRLAIKLGGTNNLSALEQVQSIEFLELWQVRGLRDLSVLSSLQRLETLFLQALPHVKELPDLSQLQHLRRIGLDNMRGLTKTRAHETAPALESFTFASTTGLDPKHFEALANVVTLKHVALRFGSRRKNEAFRQFMTAAGKSAA